MCEKRTQGEKLENVNHRRTILSQMPRPFIYPVHISDVAYGVNITLLIVHVFAEDPHFNAGDIWNAVQELAHYWEGLIVRPQAGRDGRNPQCVLSGIKIGHWLFVHQIKPNLSRLFLQQDTGKERVALSGGGLP